MSSARPLRLRCSRDVAVARGVAVVLGQRAVGDHEQLHVLEQPGAGPEAVALVAVDLVERLADVDAAALELHVHHRQAVDEHGDVVAVGDVRRLALPTSYWLMTCSWLLWMLLLVDELDVLLRAVVTLQDLDMVFLDARGLLDDAVVGAGDAARRRTVPTRRPRTRSC